MASITKRKMISKQKEARMKNLEKGRIKRMKALKQKKESKAEEYDLSSDAEWSSAASQSSSDDNGFVISRKKKAVPKVAPTDNEIRTRRKVIDKRDFSYENNLKKDVDELKSMVKESAILHKKQSRAVKDAKTKARAKRSSGGTKIVVLPQNNSQQNNRNPNDSVMDALRKSIMG